MARRKNLGMLQTTRDRIQGTKLVQRLESHALGELELSVTQIKAIEVLLKKTMPDLSAVELNADVQQTNVVSDEPIGADEWEKRYTDSLGTTAGATKSPH